MFQYYLIILVYGLVGYMTVSMAWTTPSCVTMSSCTTRAAPPLLLTRTLSLKMSSRLRSVRTCPGPIRERVVLC